MPVDRSAIADLYPFDAHYLDMPGGRMHFVSEGDGRPIVMLHGNPTWSFYYRNLIAGLKDRFQTIAPDHMGCGLSDKPSDYPYTLSTHIENFERLADHLSLDDVTLVVHDWGGPIGFGWATRHSERVRDIVVFNTAAFLSGKMPFRIRISGWPIVGEAAVLGCNAFARAAVRLACCRRERMTPRVAAGYLAPYDSPAHRVAVLRFVRDIPYNARIPSYAEFERIEAALPSLRAKPMTVFWGMRDFCFTPRFLDEWEKKFPDAEVHRFDDAGHYVVEDAHERILAVLDKRLK